MNPITAEWLALADAITAAGVPATVDPGRILTLTAANLAAVLLLPPDPEGRALSSHHLTVPVVLATAGPYNQRAVERLHDALLVVLKSAPAVGDILREPWDASDGVSLPAQRWHTYCRVKI